MRALGLLTLLSIAAPAGDRDRDRRRVEETFTHILALGERGRVYIEDSFGELKIEGWDRSDVEITVRRGTQKRYKPGQEWKGRDQLDSVVVESRRSGDDVIIRTRFPNRRLTRMFRGKTNLRLEYIVRVPSRAALQVNHSIGEVVVANVVGDLRVTSDIGEVKLRLPRGREYEIDARTRIGDVNSRLAGRSRRVSLLGAEFRLRDGTGAGRVYARLGIGEIKIDPMD
jgi:hypothetical protein